MSSESPQHSIPPSSPVDPAVVDVLRALDPITRAGLVATGEFESDRRMLQRLIYRDQAAGFSMPVDLIPFRGVAAAASTIA